MTHQDIRETYAAAHMAALAKQEHLLKNPPWHPKKVCARIAERAAQILVQLAEDGHTRAHKSYIKVAYGHPGLRAPTAIQAELRFPSTHSPENQYTPYSDYETYIIQKPSPSGLRKLFWRIHHAFAGDARFVEHHAMQFVTQVAVAEALHNSKHRMPPPAAVAALHEKQQIALATPSGSATESKSRSL
jgi:hypothetical protein